MSDLSQPLFDDAGRLTPRQKLALVIMMTGTLVAVLDNFIVFVAMPSIRTNLDASFGQAGFVIAIYTLAFAVGLITGGRLGDRYGRRRVFSIGFAAFVITSGLCGCAQSADMLITARFLQGLSAALFSPQVLAMIRVSFASPRQRATAFAFMGVVIGVASVMGQILGGLLVAANLWGLSWRPVFLINLPIGVAALAIAPYVLDESYAADLHKLDLAGSVLSAASLGMLLYPLAEGREAGWPGWCFAMMATSSAGLFLLFLHQKRKSDADAAPLIDMRVFEDRAFSTGALLNLLFYATLSPVFLSFTYLLQLGLGCAPLAAALYFSPLAIAFAVTSFVVGRTGGRYGLAVIRYGAVTALAGVVSISVLCSWVAPLLPIAFMPSLVVLGIGQGLFMTPLTNEVLSRVAVRHAGVAAGLLTTAQRAGNAFGVAALEIPFFAKLDHARAAGMDLPHAYLQAFSAVTACVAFVLFAVCVTLFRAMNIRK